jgi:hypothetical protein
VNAGTSPSRLPLRVLPSIALASPPSAHCPWAQARRAASKASVSRARTVSERVDLAGVLPRRKPRAKARALPWSRPTWAMACRLLWPARMATAGRARTAVRGGAARGVYRGQGEWRGVRRVTEGTWEALVRLAKRDVATAQDMPNSPTPAKINWRTALTPRSDRLLDRSLPVSPSLDWGRFRSLSFGAPWLGPPEPRGPVRSCGSGCGTGRARYANCLAPIRAGCRRHPASAPRPP